MATLISIHCVYHYKIDLKKGRIKLLFFPLSFINKSLVFYSFGIFYEIPIMLRKVYILGSMSKQGGILIGLHFNRVY